jgi:hypothetical protein
MLALLPVFDVVILHKTKAANAAFVYLASTLVN